MRLKIYHTRAARRDFETIWTYVQKDGRATADRLIRTITAKIVVLAERPEAGRRRPEYGEVRSFPVSRYLIFYRFDETTLHVVRIIDSARDIQPEMFDDA